MVTVMRPMLKAEPLTAQQGGLAACLLKEHVVLDRTSWSIRSLGNRFL